MNHSTNKETLGKLMLILSMLIFGTIGVFRRYLPLPSSLIALVRGGIGTLFLLATLLITHQKLSIKAIKKNGIYLLLSGILLGFNWILLFEAYRYTSVATATLCYYMAPIFVLLTSPILLKERLTIKKTLCVLIAFIGMIFVSGILKVGVTHVSEMKGILFGISAALFYACIILCNQKIKDISAYDKTIVQLGITTLVLLPYTLATEDLFSLNLPPSTVLLLIVVGVIHTGIAYILYFGSMKNLKAQTIALFSYIDPVVAIILSTLLLKEMSSTMDIVGTVLVLSATLISELPEKKQ